MALPTDTYSPEHMSAERRAYTIWKIATAAVILVAFALSFALSPLVYWLASQPFSHATMLEVDKYLIRLSAPSQILAAHDSVWQTSIMAGIYCVGGAMLSTMFVGAMFFIASPFRNLDATHGLIKWATIKDIRRMEKRGQVGIEGGYVGVLGKWKDGTALRLIEPISVSCPAPPGSGKTAALVVPAIVDSPTVSMIVNDPKPELAQMTSGYRAEIGHVFILDWSATDKPEKGIFYPRFNFLSSSLVPPAGTAERDTYIEAICRILIPDQKSGDKFFSDRGRDALVGFVHFLLNQVNDNKDYTGIPEQWHGMEASFPMLIDWIAHANYEADKEAQRLKEQAQAERSHSDAEGEKIFFKTLIERAKEKRYSERAFNSLVQLNNMAPNTRSSVTTTMDQALIPFKNRSVMERTSASDFSSRDLRGMQDPETGEWLPVTLYICVNQAEASAFANITALLFEVLSRDFLSYGPNEKNKRGEKMGPLTICFMMDEFAKLPKCETVLKGPDLGRSKKVSYWLFYQAKPQMVEVYGKEPAESLESTIGVHIVLPQNDPSTAEHYIKMVGKTTVVQKNQSRNAGFSKQANPFARNESFSAQGVNFLRTEDITAMESGTHLVLAQGFHNRPLKMRSPFFFKDPAMLEKVYNPRTKQGPQPAPPLPEHIRQRRLAEWQEREARRQELATRQQAAELPTFALGA